MSRPELYKDKIEVSLDGRQIFYLFFGGAVIVGLVFVLGVMVGRRVEARGHVERARTEAAVDPLAALDRLEGGAGLSFQGALRGGDAPARATPDVEKTITDLAKQREQQKPPAKPPVVVKPPEVKPEPPKPEPKPEAKPEPKPEPEKKADADKPEKKQKFTLQLSSFQDKGEAEAYLAQVKADGFDAHVTEGDVDGKTYYRVRMGNYRSIDAANDAKAEIEKATKKSATVMKL